MVEMQFGDFITCAFNQIVNNVAKTHYRWGAGVPLVIRAPIGGGTAAEALHHGLTKGRHLARRFGGERPGTELASRAVGVSEALERRLALARRGERDAGAQLDLGAIEGQLDAAQQLHGARTRRGDGNLTSEPKPVC